MTYEPLDQTIRQKIVTSKQGKWVSAGDSITGPVRQNNEDRIYADDKLGIWCVADGMGGHVEGGVASSLITQTLEDLQKMSPKSSDDFLSILIDILKSTNEIIYSLSNDMFDSKQIIGSTFVILVIFENKGYVLWSGDSRLYRMRDVYFEQVTVDHTQYESLKSQQLLDDETNSSPLDHPASHILTKAMGVKPVLEYEFVEIDIQQNDIFLLCSDGLYNVLEQVEIGKSLYYADDYQSAVNSLINSAVMRGTSDNVSAIVVGISNA